MGGVERHRAVAPGVRHPPNLTIDPEYAHRPAPVRLLGGAPEEGQAVLAPLTGPAALVTAVARGGLRLRHRMPSRKPPRAGPVGDQFLTGHSSGFL